MAENFEPYHVPQWSRRDKLRVGAPTTSIDALTSAGLPTSAGLLPLYDPSVLPSDLLTCTVAAAAGFHSPNPSATANINSGAGDTNLFTPTHLRDLAHSYSTSNSNNALSLSLSFHSHNNCHERYGSAASSAGGYLIPAASSPVGPFTASASTLKGSRFLRAAQELLKEFCDVGHGPPERMEEADSSLAVYASTVESLSNGESSSINSLSNSGDAGELSIKKSRLMWMLDEVCRRYKQYYQQLQDVVESFEYVSGLSNAAPCAILAVKAMSKHFRCLKNAITEQLQLNKNESGHGNPKGKDEPPRLGNKDGSTQYGQRYFEHQPIWRPQRGLPERAVTVLRGWLFEHFLHPYPNDTDKIMLAKQTGLSRSQVSNWFINARVRIWKPMVEEIHMLETQQKEDQDGSNFIPSTRSFDKLSNLMNSSLRSEEPTSTSNLSKRTRNDLPDVSSLRSNRRHDPKSYDDLSNFYRQPHDASSSVGEGIGGVNIINNNNVSLSLGLHHQNDGMNLQGQFQVNAIQRFGIGLEGNDHGGGAWF